MKRSFVRDLTLVVVTGAAMPYLLVAVWGSVHAAIRGPSGRIAAFLTPGLYHPKQNLGILAVDAALGLVIGALLAGVIARFTCTGRWILGLAFAAALLISALAVPGSESTAARIAWLAHQPMILFVLGGASLGFCLGPRGGKTTSAH